MIDIQILLLRIKVMVDAGAYNGDTAREAIQHFCGLKKIYAIEPDKKNFKKLHTLTNVQI